MKREAILLTACVAAAVIVGGAAAIELLGTYATPCSQPRGYAFSGLYAGWLVDGAGAGRVYQVQWTTGSVTASFAPPGGAGAWGLCTVLGRNLYLSNNRTSYIYRLTTTGSVMGSCRCPLDGPADMSWSYAGNYAYVAIPDRNVVAAVNAVTGSLIRTYAGPGKRAVSCAGSSGAYVGDADTHTVYFNGKSLITGVASPLGLEEVSTYVDATYLYVVDDATDRMYMYHSGLPVTPASLGRVKALFR